MKDELKSILLSYLLLIVLAAVIYLGGALLIGVLVDGSKYEPGAYPGTLKKEAR